jgi:hypothetical protein
MEMLETTPCLVARATTESWEAMETIVSKVDLATTRFRATVAATTYLVMQATISYMPGMGSEIE